MQDIVSDDYRRAEARATAAMRSAANQIKADWRGQIVDAGLGNRLANTVRAQAYPQGEHSLNAAALIWTKAPVVVAAHDKGALIQSANGFWLAIPLEAAGRGRFGRRMTPGEFEQRTGQRLRFVYRRGRSGLLVADNARVSARGQARRKGGRRRKDGVLTGAQTVPVFVLVRQVKLKKRTDLVGGADRIADGIEARVAAAFEV